MRLICCRGLLALSIVIEIVEHQIQIWVYIFCKMVFYFVFLIYWDSKSLLILNKCATTIYLLLSLSKICILNIGLVIISECPRLRKIGWTLWLMYQSSIHLLKIIFILLHHSWYLLSIRGLCIFHSRVKSMHSHSLLGLRRSWSNYLLLLKILALLLLCRVLIAW